MKTMKTIKRLVVLVALTFITIISLASCKGTGTYYQKGHEASTVKITSEYWITKTSSYPITWVDDNHFTYGNDLYYCDGSIMYNLKNPDYWYITEITQHVQKEYASI